LLAAWDVPAGLDAPAALSPSLSLAPSRRTAAGHTEPVLDAMSISANYSQRLPKTADLPPQALSSLIILVEPCPLTLLDTRKIFKHRVIQTWYPGAAPPDGSCPCTPSHHDRLSRHAGRRSCTAKKEL